MSRRARSLAAAFCLAAGTVWTAAPGLAQERAPGADWPLHNLDHYNSRFSPLAELDRSNVGSLELKWSLQTDVTMRVGEVSPLVIDGVMYFHSGSTLFAVDAATGEPVWTFEAAEPFTGGGRGPAYGDGRIYAYGQTIMYAVDARTGVLVESFGRDGMLSIINEALSFKYPDTYPPTIDPRSIGYSMTNPPAYRDGTLYVGLPFSDSLLPGGLLVAADGETGAVKWVFNSIPQGPRDSGWEISRDTWSNPGRYGGGIWTQPAVDAELGMIYFNAANPSPNYDGSSRKGMNLFTNSMLAVDIETGELAWYFQTLHHDIWDWDLVAGPILFDIEVDGRPVKGIASLGKTCYVYMLDRATGEPLNPIVETAVPTVTDVPGEEVWPTQPIPYTAAGIPQQPFCATWPLITDPALKPRARQIFHPHSVNEFLIVAPGLMGGANFGSPSFSPRTGLLYATGKNDAWSIKVRPVGDTLEPGPGNMGHFAGFTEEGETGVTRKTTLAAYEPGTGRRAWYTEIDGMTNSGNLATAGDLVFQGAGTGHFYAFDAATGEQLFQHEADTGIRSSPTTFQAGGAQYVTVIAANTVLTFGLP